MWATHVLVKMFFSRHEKTKDRICVFLLLHIDEISSYSYNFPITAAMGDFNHYFPRLKNILFIRCMCSQISVTVSHLPTIQPLKMNLWLRRSVRQSHHPFWPGFNDLKNKFSQQVSLAARAVLLPDRGRKFSWTKLWQKPPASSSHDTALQVFSVCWHLGRYLCPQSHLAQQSQSCQHLGQTRDLLNVPSCCGIRCFMKHGFVCFFCFF